MTDHSSAAALVGACECRSCQEFDAGWDTDDWWLFVIRSFDPAAIKAHRVEMIGMGFTVGPIEMAQLGDGIPVGWFKFSARIPRAVLTDEEYDSLVVWDRKYAERA